MAVDFEVNVPGLKYSESVGKFEYLREKDVITEVEEVFVEAENNDIGTIRKGQTAYGEEVMAWVQVTHFSETRPTDSEPTEGLRFYYSELMSVDRDPDRANQVNFGSIAETLSVLTNIADELKESGELVETTLKRGQP